MPAKILEAFDRQRDDLVILSFPLECVTATAYVDQVVEQLNLQAEAAGVQLATESRPLCLRFRSMRPISDDRSRNGSGAGGLDRARGRE